MNAPKKKPASNKTTSKERKMTGLSKTACLLILTASLSGCGGSPSEGRAAAILDASKPRAEAHAAALAGDDVAKMRETGVTLLAGLRCWWKECGK